MNRIDENSGSKHWRNIFEQYFSQLLATDKTIRQTSGPYISISRDFGCMANDLAKRLTLEFNVIEKRNNSHEKWRWINKEILNESARALDMSPSKIKYVFMSQQKSMMDEIIGALSTRYYKSDKKIRNTIIEVIRTIAKSGHVIIVGRGGVAFSTDNTKSLHIKLVAPIDWRIQRISKIYGRTPDQAKKYIFEVDKERKYLIDSFMGIETDNSIFDITLNRKTLSEDEIVGIILKLAQSKGLLQTPVYPS